MGLTLVQRLVGLEVALDVGLEEVELVAGLGCCWDCRLDLHSAAHLVVTKGWQILPRSEQS